MAVDEVYLTSWHIPASVIRKWPRPNFENPERRFGAIPLYLVLLSISTTFVAARMYVRATGKAGRFGLDDFLIVLAWAFGVVTISGSIRMITNAGLDRHVWDAILVGSRGGLAAWLLELAFSIEANATKLSVLVFYRRLFFTLEPRKRFLHIDVPIIALLLFAIVTVFILIFDCQPTAAYWLSMDANYGQPYTCIDRHILDPTKGAINVLTDVYALLLPQFFIWRMNLKVLCRFRLAFIFGCGWLATGAGIARTVWLSRLFTDPLRDLTWVGYSAQIWAHTETQLAIVCASVPVAIVVAHQSSRSGRDSQLESGTCISESNDLNKSTAVKQIKVESPAAEDKQGKEWLIVIKSKFSKLLAPC